MNAADLTMMGMVLLGLGLSGAGAAEQAITLHPKCEKLFSPHMGPYVNLGDDAILAVIESQALISRNEGKTWAESHPLFADKDKFLARPERALLRTREGVMVMGFLNEKEIRRGEWKLNDPEAMAKFYLPTYITRSTDEGKTWEPPQKIQDGWCGAIRHLIQLRTGRLVLAGQEMVFPPCRHVVMTYVSDDLGKTWKRSNAIDLGGAGSHAGAMEATLAERQDGRLWMLIRTTHGWFWETFSEDGGLSWSQARKSAIQSSTCCGMLARLQSGRLALLWNRAPESRPDDWTSREELSLAFSDDDGATWSKPVVLARDPVPAGDKPSAHRLSYPHLFERRPGELWITTMQGLLRIRLHEKDFVANP